MEARKIEQRRSARILIVEDEAIVRKDLEMTLKAHGHDVVASCSSATDAISLCGEHHPNLVLMDIMLRSDGSGIDAAKAIRTHLGTPVVFLTANADADTISRARLTLPQGFLTKPYKTVDVLAAIDLAVFNHGKESDIRHERDRLKNTLNGIEGSLFIKVKDREEAIPLREIHYVEALKDYGGIHVNERRYVIHSTMTEMEGRLPQDAFMR
ncbi:MAG TPA: response regulator, partial [Flavobacteriales bacterium]|nr:response regulator [Flavobacteriales bacterium]